MKKIFLLIPMILVFLICGGCASTANSYLRVHIRANSNSETDQNVKYLVKDVVVEYLTPKLSDCESKTQVIDVLNDNMESVKELINKTLLLQGFDYGCSIDINEEFFPTRTYGELTLEADYYDALIIRLGTGTGDNWWCVIYPNLCFNEVDNVVYKSKIKEIIEKIKE